MGAIAFSKHMYTAVCKQMAGGNLYSTGSSAQCSVMTLDGRDEEGGRGGLREGKLTQHCEAIILQ